MLGNGTFYVDACPQMSFFEAGGAHCVSSGVCSGIPTLFLAGLLRRPQVLGLQHADRTRFDPSAARAFDLWPCLAFRWGR